jgi:hypothetical protein
LEILLISSATSYASRAASVQTIDQTVVVQFERRFVSGLRFSDAAEFRGILKRLQPLALAAGSAAAEAGIRCGCCGMTKACPDTIRFFQTAPLPTRPSQLSRSFAIAAGRQDLLELISATTVLSAPGLLCAA